MSGNRSVPLLNRTLRIGSFYARHLLALAVTVVTPCILWTIVYFALLLRAIVFGGGIGSPIAYPIGLLVLFVGALGAGLMLLFPSTVFAEWVVRRQNLPMLAQIPISIATLAALCLATVGISTALGPDPTLRDVCLGFGLLFAMLLLPLGLYWWTAQSGPLLLAVIRRIRAVFQRR